MSDIVFTEDFLYCLNLILFTIGLGIISKLEKCIVVDSILFNCKGITSLDNNTGKIGKGIISLDNKYDQKIWQLLKVVQND